jgi:uncharacterized protein DUF4412
MRTVIASPVLFGVFSSLFGLSGLAYGCSRQGTSSSGGEAGAADLLASSGASLAFLNGFEGEIDVVFKDSKPGEAPVPVQVYVKSSKLRVDIPEKIAQKNPLGAKAYVLFDSPAKKVYVVSDAQKQALVIDLTKSGEQLKGLQGIGGPPSHGGGAPQGPATQLVKTGKFDTVAGYKCENWDVMSDHRETTACVAQEGASWFSIPMTGVPTERLWMAELLDGKHFPLRLVIYAPDGVTEKSRIEVTKIDKKTPAASQFEYPSSYRVLDLAQMFQGLAGLAGGMQVPTPLPRAKAH